MSVLPKPARRRAFPLAGIALALAVPVASAAVAVEEPVLDFAAGRAQGNYYALADALREELEEQGRAVRVHASAGSYDNAERLRAGEADLALLQSDVAYLEYYNQRPFVALSSVYTEPIHIIAFTGLGLRRVSEVIRLEDRLSVAVGAPGSGTSAHAHAVLHELRLLESELRPGEPSRLVLEELSLDQVEPGLRDGSVDLAFVTIAVPSQVVRELARHRIISLLGIDRDIAHRLRRRNPFFVAAEIPWEAYGVTDRNIQTLGTRTLLVTRPDLSDRDVDQILDALYDVADRAGEGRLPFLEDLSPARALTDLAIPMHSAARTYHRKAVGPLGGALARLRRYALPLIVVGALFLALFRLSRIAYFVHQFVLGRVLLSLVVVWWVGSMAMYFFEHEKNSAFRSLRSSAIAILHYLFSGLESKYPVTTGGNVVAILVLSLGVGIVTLFTATLVTLLVERSLNIKTLRKKPVPFLRLSGHTVIAGWSERTKRIIRQLRSPDLRSRPTVVVIAPKASATTVEDRRHFRGVWVVEGDRSHSDTLLKADVATASHAVVIATDAPGAGGDPTSISCALAIDRLAPATHTIVETRASTAVEHMNRLRAEEIVDTETLAERLLSQCVITPGIAKIYDELLSFGKGSQEIYLLPIGRPHDRLCFDEIRDRLRSFDAIPLGYWRRGERRPRLNPAAAARVPLAADGPIGDRLIVLADSPAALTSFRARIKLRRDSMSESKKSKGNNDEQSRPTPPKTAGSNGDEVQPRAPRRAVRIGVCGWNAEARAVIRQLQESVVATYQEFEITVIDGPKPKEIEHECTRNVRFVFGDPTRSEVLENAGVGDVQTLVVLADRSDSESKRYSDHRALVICLAAREVNPDLHLIAQVLHSDNQEHFQRMEGVEIVSVEDLAEKLLAQAVISPGITAIFLKLLTATEDSNEIYVVPVPARWEGRPFSRIAADIQEGERPAVALGYRITPQEGHPVIILNPQQRKSERHGVVDWRQQPLGRDDGLVVMAYEEPSW